jgi:hypothetical protein
MGWGKKEWRKEGRGKDGARIEAQGMKEQGKEGRRRKGVGYEETGLRL